MIEGIVFDMDGVIVDTEHLHCGGYITTLSNHGIQLSQEEFYEHWTKKGKDIAEFIKERSLNLNPQIIRNEKIKLYHSQLKKELKLYKGAKEKILELSLDYPLALVTNSYRQDVDLILRLTELSHYFKVLVAREDVRRSKPEPEGFLLASEKLAIKPENIVVIEDAEKGLIAAKRAGMKCVIIPNEYTADNDFSSADYILKNISELSDDLIRRF